MSSTQLLPGVSALGILGAVLGRLLTAASGSGRRRAPGPRGDVRARNQAHRIAVASALCGAFAALSSPSRAEAVVIVDDFRAITDKGSGGTTLGFNVALTPCGPVCDRVPIPFPSVGQSDGTTTYQSKIPVVRKRGEGAMLGIPYDVFLPADEAGVATISLVDSITHLVNFSFVINETSTGVLVIDAANLPVKNFDIVVELSLAAGGSEPETRLLIPFFEGVGVTSVPEPSVLVLFASGLLGLTGYRAGAERRRQSPRPGAGPPQG